jgi:hypothetical protein
MTELENPDSRTGETRSDETLGDAYAYMLALVQADPDKAVTIQARYCNETIRELFGAVTGVWLGILSKTGESFRDKVAAGLRFGLDGDRKHLDAIADEPLGGYL